MARRFLTLNYFLSLGRSRMVKITWKYKSNCCDFHDARVKVHYDINTKQKSWFNWSNRQTTGQNDPPWLGAFRANENHTRTERSTQRLNYVSPVSQWDSITARKEFIVMRAHNGSYITQTQMFCSSFVSESHFAYMLKKFGQNYSFFVLFWAIFWRRSEKKVEKK